MEKLEACLHECKLKHHAMTELAAASIASLLHCFHLALVIPRAADADLDLDLPLFLCPLDSKDRQGKLEFFEMTMTLS